MISTAIGSISNDDDDSIVSLIAFVIVIFLVTYVVPQVATVFTSSKRALPFLTILMVGAAQPVEGQVLPALADMKVAELRVLADQESVDLGAMTKKPDIIAAILQSRLGVRPVRCCSDRRRLVASSDALSFV